MISRASFYLALRAGLLSSAETDGAVASSVSSLDCRGFGPGVFPEFNARSSAIL